MSSPSEPNQRSNKFNSPYAAVFILTIATFMSVLDSTVVNVSLPKMASDLGTTPTETVWAITSYIVALAAVLPISGWLATYFGRKRYYLASVAGFTVASVLCGLATNLETLIIFRILQGISAGGIAPSEQAIIADITPQRKLGRTFAIYGLGISIAPILGPTLGGFITDALSWHWIFFINLPLGIISIVLTSLFVKESAHAEKATRDFRTSGTKADWLGVFLFVTGIATLELLLVEGPQEGWFESDFVILICIYSVLALVIGILWEYYQKHPAVDVRMFRERSFTSSCVLIWAVTFVVTGSSFLIPYYSQVLLGYSAMDAGMVGLPATIAQMIVIQLVGFMSDKTDVRRFIFVGLALITLTVWNFMRFNLHIGYENIVWARIYYSASIGFLATTINTVAYYHIAPEKNNNASSMLNLVRNMGASMGVALTSTVIAVNTQVHINNLGANASSFNPNYTETLKNLAQSLQNYGMATSQTVGAAKGMIWNEIVRQATMNAVINAFEMYVILQICVLPLAFLLKGKKNEELYEVKFLRKLWGIIFSHRDHRGH